MSPRPTPEREAVLALLERCRVAGGAGFALDRHDPAAPPPAGLDKHAGEALLAAGTATLAGLQERLYAHGRWALLVVIQAMDAAGKDGTISHVLSGVNPAGVAVTSFKAPGPEDLAHDFLWRPGKALPARGMIGVFNRSYYEDVLVPRVEPAALERQHLPQALSGDAAFWDRRLDDIRAFERHLGREGTRVIKLYLDVSREEQGRRLRARLDEPDKQWKFDPADLVARDKWDAYRAAYDHAIAATAAPDAPWYVIPADRKWLMRLLAVEAINAALGALDLTPPAPSAETLAAVASARRALDGGR